MGLVLKRHWAAALLFLVLALVLTNPLILHVWNAVEDKQDALLNTWIIGWVGHAAITNPLGLYNTNIFYPYANTLAFSEVLVPQGLLALPVTLATGNSIFGYNLVLLAMLWLDAFGMYLLVFDWMGEGGMAAGWIAGAIYAFNPFNLGNLAQIQLLTLGWLPLALLFLRRMASGSRKGVMTRAVVLFALFFILQALSSIYYALIGGTAVACYVVYLLVNGARHGKGEAKIEPQRTQRENLYKSWRPSRGGWFIFRLFVAGALIAVMLAPFLLPYFQVQRDLGFHRSVEESEPFSANLKQFTEVSPQNVVYGKWLAPNPVHYEGGYPLDNLFPGVFALVFAIAGLWRGRGPRGFLLALLLTSFVLALGPRLYLAAGQPANVTLPYFWLYKVFAPLQALRAPVRFEALIMFAIAALAGMGIANLGLGDRNSQFKIRNSKFAMGWVLLIALEYLALPAANITVLPVAGEIDPEYRWLAAQPHGVILELPMMGLDASQRLDISKEYLSTYHWQDTPDGYSGFNPPGRGAFEYEMRFFPSARSISLLQAYGVRDVILHWNELAEIPGTIGPGQLDDVAGLQPVQEGDMASVYAVTPNIQTPDQLTQSLYIPAPVAAGAPFTAYVILHNTGDSPYAVKATDRVQWTASWSSGEQEQVSTGAPLVTSSASVIPVRLTAPAHPGKVEFTLQASGGPLGAFTLKGNANVGSEGAQEVVIPARVELASPFEPTYAPGATVDVPLNWLPLNKIDAYYSASVRLVDAQGNKVLNVDREPSGQTLLWIPETIIRDHFVLTLPRDLKPGVYRVQVLMYDANSDTSVLLLDASDHPFAQITLGEFDVK
ncbi:MAG: hypothetical protein WCF84_15885 [Anaerolineae bacterium]